MRLPILASLAFALAAQAGPPQDEAARARAAGVPPPPPVMTVGAGEVVLEVTVTPGGRVGRIDPLRTTVPFTDMVTAAVEPWRFVPATIVKEGRPEPIESTVLVVAFYRPPALYMGNNLGDPVRDVGRPSGLAPSVRDLQVPPYPPNSKGDATVLLEVELTSGGAVSDVKVMRSGGGFDQPALDTVRRWQFTPARVAGPARTYAYVILGFREPTVPSLQPTPRPIPR